MARMWFLIWWNWMDGLLNNCHSVSAEPERRGCKSLKHGSKKGPGDV